MRQVDQEVFEEYQRCKMRLLKLTSDQLKDLCKRFEFQCGCGATKEAMARGLLAEHIACMDCLPTERVRSTKTGFGSVASRGSLRKKT